MHRPLERLLRENGNPSVSVSGSGATAPSRVFALLCLPFAAARSEDLFVGCGEGLNVSMKTKLFALLGVSTDTRSFVTRGDALLRTGKIGEAAREYNAALRVEPTSAPAHEGLGTAFALAGNSESAINEYREALRLDPSADRHVLLGLELVSKSPEMAVAEYEKALAIKPSHLMAHHFLGQALKDIGELARAANHFQECTRLRPDDPDSHWCLGETLEESGDEDGAAKEYLIARSLAPSDPDIREMFRLLRPEMKRRMRAVNKRPQGRQSSAS